MTIHETDDPDPGNIGEQKKRSIYLISFLFFLLILAVPLFWLIRGNNPLEFSVVEQRNLKKFSFAGLGFKTALEKITQGEILEGVDRIKSLLQDQELQVQLQKAASDQFPLRLAAIKAVRSLDRELINLVYMGDDENFIPVSMKQDTGLFIMKDRKTFIYKPKPFMAETTKDIDKRIEDYKLAIETFPSINFYLYYVERITYSQYNPLTPFFSFSDSGQAFSYFDQHKPDNLYCGGFFITSFSDYEKYFYKTDHHWNIHGALLGYEGIYDLLKQNYPEISSVHTYTQFITLDDVNYRGSSARMSFYPIEGEKFEIVDFNLPPFETYENGVPIQYAQWDEYLSGHYSREDYFDHYGAFFGHDRPFIELVFDNQTDRNILIFSNSFDNPIIPLIASHYSHTYSVNLLLNDDFSLPEFLSTHPVDDILVIGENSVALESQEWKLNP